MSGLILPVTKTAMIKNLTILFSLTALAVSCGGSNEAASASALAGRVRIDGSSTVFPITEAVAEEFNKVQPRVRVGVSVSGTGGGFKKFAIEETDINDASRPIKGEEVKKAAEHKVEFIELPVAFDGISVVINKDNDFVDHLTTAELKRIWKPGSKVSSWDQVRSGWPNEAIKLYGPGTDSGTFDYFTKAINGKEQACRPDFTQSEDDNVIVNGVAGSKYSMGFFGFAYYVENKDKLKVVPIKNGAEAIAPSVETINNGTYAPLSRPIFIYVSKASAARPEVAAFIDFYLEQAPLLVGEVGYVALPQKAYDMAKKRFSDRVTGSVFRGVKTSGRQIEDIMSR